MKKLALVVLALATLGACKGGSGKGRRSGSAAPVEVVTQPELPDAGRGSGPSVEEVEPNDGDEVATPLGIGGTARGKLETENDIDYYRIEVDRPGTLQVALSGIEGTDLVLELADSAGAVIAKSDRGGARVKEGVPNAGVTAGRYAVIVKHAPKKKTKSKAKKGAAEPAAPAAAPVYEVTVQLGTVLAGSEREPDDDRGTANDLIIADNALGYLGWANDADVWKLSVETLSEKNVLDVQVSAVDGVALELVIADALGTTLATRKAPRSAPLVVRGLLPAVAEGAPPFTYLTVRGSASNPESSYTLHASARLLGTDEEIEPNDLADKPFPMPADRTVVHATWSPGDVDCFSIPATEAARTIDVSIDTPAELNLDVELLVDGKPVATGNKGGKGVIEKVSAQIAAGIAPVIRVKNPDAGANAEAKYDVSVQESSATGDNAP